MSKEHSFDAEDPVQIHHSAHASGPRNDVRQSSGVQLSRSTRNPKTSSRSRDDIEMEGLEPELIRPRSPIPVLPAAAPIAAPEQPEPSLISYEPSASHRLPEQNHDRSDSFPLPEAARTVFIPPPAPSAPQMPAQDSHYLASRPKTMSYNSGIQSLPPPPSRKLSHSAYNPTISIRSVPPLSRESPYNPGTRFAPPSRQLPFTTYGSSIRTAPPPSRQMPEIMHGSSVRTAPPTSRQLPEIIHGSSIRTAPPTSRQIPETIYDSGPQTVPLPSRQMPSHVNDSGPYSVPLRPLQRTPYAGYGRARRGDAFIANDPFRPGLVKNESETYDSFDNMPTPIDTDAPIAMPPPDISSQPPDIPPVVPSQPPIVPPQPPALYSARPSQSPVLPSVLPSQHSVVAPINLPPRSSPILNTMPMPPPQDNTDTEGVPNGPLLAIPEPEPAPHSPGLPFIQPFSDPIQLEDANEYLLDDDIDTNKKFSFWSALQKLFTWPFARPRKEPSPDAYNQLPHSYPPYPPGFTPETYVPTPSYTQVAGEFLTRTLPTQAYSYFLLRLPSLYFSRVARIFEEADLTLPEIKKMALETASKDMVPDDFYAFEFANVPPQYMRLKSTWESFIDCVMREWKTFNIISVLLLSAILTILQIQSAEQDPIIRYTALASLICALISLLFGCMYIIRFGSMRKPYKAAEWALEAKRTRTTVWWNVWVLLAMPVIWLVWSIILYLACIMTFIWRTTSQDVSPPLIMSETTVLVIRVVLSSVLALGILYATLILSTFRRYGETMDKAWKRRISGWIESKTGIYGPGQPGPDSYNYPPPISHTYPIMQPPTSYPFLPEPQPPSPDIPPPFTHDWTQSRSAPEVSRYPSQRDRPTSTPSFSSSQETLSGLLYPARDGTGRQSLNKELDASVSSPLLQVPMKPYLPSADHPEGAPIKHRVSVPPARVLPTIPGTPLSSALAMLTSSPPSVKSLGLDDQNSAQPESGEVEPTPPSRRDSSIPGTPASTLSYLTPQAVSTDLPPSVGSPILDDQNLDTAEVERTGSSLRDHHVHFRSPLASVHSTTQEDATPNLEEIELERDSRARVGFQQQQPEQPVQQPQPQPSVVQPDAKLGQRQLDAQAEHHQQQHISGSPPYVYDPLYTYADPNAQAWAYYYAQGGRDPTGSVYFHFVPGVTPRQPAVAAAVSQTQPAVEARPTEQEQQQQQRQQKDDD